MLIGILALAVVEEVCRALNKDMWSIISGFVAKNKLSLLKYAAYALVLAGVLFWIWLSEEHKQNLAEQVGQQKGEISLQAKRIEALEASNKALNDDFTRVRQSAQKLIDDLAKVRDEVADRARTIGKHDLDAIGAKKPRMLEGRINQGTRDLFKRFEEITKP